ncbi:MAG: polysaccharide biosynthesis protein [Clostridiales bacterium]|nr:polysaccharide biosynthesis protein [Candidatus Cacconaster stercorequi]
MTPGEVRRLTRTFIIMVMDILAVAASFFVALWARFEFRLSAIPAHYLATFLTIIKWWIPICIVVFWLFHLYNSLWSYVSIDSLFWIILAYSMLLILGVACVKLFGIHMPRSFYFVGYFLSFLCTAGIRFSYRILRRLRQLLDTSGRRFQKNVMIIGAGEAGCQLIHEFAVSPQLGSRVACLIDDNPGKKGRNLEGVRIIGGREMIVSAVKRYNIDKIIYAIPTSSGATRREILDICSTTGCEIQVVPGIFQLVNGEVRINALRKVSLLDLLGRDPVQVNLQEICHYITGKVVMVTGGGGSIGSELCRQIAASHPLQLIIFDIYENNAYDIQMELHRTHPELDLVVLIGSVRDPRRLDDVLGQYRPELVFHAAAHKHVPLMESSPNEAIKNNVFGTYKMAHAAREFGVRKFILISTDKAVNPTNIMGASKRLCEMVVQMLSRRGGTEFVAVRFGNVLGSNGSVVPLFEKQIAEGGPVTVTHPEITRFFMTIPEAVSLVLQAGYYAKGGEIFVLDMGNPVRIDDMARKLIRLSGFEPDVDIPVVYTGLRPGEKLYEELLMNEEGLQETANSMIHIGKPIEMDDAAFALQLKALEQACEENSPDICKLVAEIVPTYHPGSH